MTIVLPLFFAAVGFGLFVRRMTLRTWMALVLIIAVVLLYNYVKTPKLSTAGPAPSSGS